MACVAYVTLLFLLVMFVPQAFVMIFTDNAELMTMAVWAIRIYMFMIVMMGIQVSCQQTFIALGNAKASVFLAVFRKILVLIPLIYILPMFFADKVFAIFLAEPVADFIAVSVTVLLFIKEYRHLEVKA